MEQNKEKNLYLGLIGIGMLFGGVAVYFDNPQLDRLLLTPCVISIGAGTAMMGVFGLRYGRIYGRSGYVYRDESPFHFWLLVVICQLGGWVMVLAGIGNLLSFSFFSG